MRSRVIAALGACPFPNIANWLLLTYNKYMKIKVIVHEAEEGGYWAEVPSIPGCATQGETFEELLQNLYEAVEGCLSVDVSPSQINESDRVLEIAV
jgi:predicted RNase H-like HicB family nuclease